MKFCKLCCNKGHRKSMFRNLISDLILYERIITTYSRAKIVKMIIDKIVSLSKKKDIFIIRYLKKFLFNKNCNNNKKIRNVLQKLYKIISLKYKDRNSGYVRILKYKKRVGDAALLVILEFV